MSKAKESATTKKSEGTSTGRVRDYDVTHAGVRLLKDKDGFYTVQTIVKRICKEVVDIMNLFSEMGIETTYYSLKLGKNRNWISNWAKNGVTSSGTLLVLRELERSAKKLLNADLKKVDLDDLLKETGVPMSTLAKVAGVSRQAIYVAKHRGGFSDTLTERLQLACKELGTGILQRSTKIRKGLI